MTLAGLDLSHQFRAREARDNFKAVLDLAEGGAVAVVNRDAAVVVVARDALEAVFGEVAPLDVRSAITNGQVSFWLDDVPVHAAAPTLDEAEDEFLDALVEYVELWFEELHRAPNHQANRMLALRVAMFAGNRDELRQVVFGDD